jgi:hypothetical protein
MMTVRTAVGPSTRRQLFFWWILFVVIQSAERLFLLKDALEAESPTPTMLYDDAVGLATSEGMLMYSLRTERLTEAALGFQVRADDISPTDPGVATQFHNLMALYQDSNAVLDQNRVWS